jgi:hypothetical protein
MTKGEKVQRGLKTGKENMRRELEFSGFAKKKLRRDKGVI